MEFFNRIVNKIQIIYKICKNNSRASLSKKIKLSWKKFSIILIKLYNQKICNRGWIYHLNIRKEIFQNFIYLK